MAIIEGKTLANIVKAEIVTEEGSPQTFEFDTADTANLEPSLSEGEENVLRIKNKILAINRTEDIAYGYEIQLDDNTLIPEVLALIDGGSLRYETPEDDTTSVVGYDAPVSGQTVDRTLFTLNLYTEEKDADGETINYAKISFVHCKGKPVSWTLEDGEFFVPSFNVESRPAKGETPFTLDFMDTLA